MDKKTEKDNSEYIKEVFKLLKIALGITLILLLIVIVSNHFLPDSRKFDKEIWGSVSDWFTYLVTLIGGVFIYKTLESQMKVQGDQNEILKLEKQKYRREKRPNLTYTLSIDRTRNSGAPYLVVIEFNSDKDTDIEFSARTEKGGAGAKLQAGSGTKLNKTSFYAIDVASSTITITAIYTDEDKLKYQLIEEAHLDIKTDTFTTISISHNLLTPVD